MSGFNHQEVFQKNWPHRGGDVDSDGHLFCAAEASAAASAEAVRGDTLLPVEDWSKRESMTSNSSNDSGADDVASVSNKGKGRHLHDKDVHVRFSEQSLLHVYQGEATSAYGEEDCEKFGKDAVLEGLRIKNLIAYAPPESGAESIKYLFSHGHGIIGREDFVGIEHFIFGTLSAQSKIRKHHVAAVLRKQLKQKQQKGKLPKAWLTCLNLDPDSNNLAKFAETISLRCKQRAKIRAGMAA